MIDLIMTFKLERDKYIRSVRSVSTSRYERPYVNSYIVLYN